MATPEQLLEEAGATILQQIRARQPLFLVEIEPSGLSPTTIIFQLGRVARWGWKPEYKAAAAWAAVQLASRAEAEEVQDEGGFRSLFFRELSREFSLNDWQDTFGYHIRRFLEATFPSVELPEPGPWHLVGAVYRHAGIPATSKTSYAQFVTKMLRGELSFSFDEYQKNLSRLPSQVVRQFLESRTGYEFTRDLARQVARVYQGGTSSVALPAWSARLVDAVVISLRESDTGSRKLKAPRSFTKPYLCLDAETYSLKIVFDSRGVREKYYWIGARPVLYPSQAVRESDSPMFRLGVVAPPEQISPWWTPAEGGWALFRVGDGALVTSGTSHVWVSVTAGDYYLVTDDPSAVPDPPESPVALDAEGLEDPVLDYWVVRVSLRPGSSIPALAVRVDADLPAPQLEWIRPSRLSTNWGAGIFLEHLPGVRLKPWNSALASEFSLTIEYGDGEIEIAVPSEGEIIGVPSRCPASGYLAIRRGGIAREIIERLRFGVVPTSCHLYAPTDVLRTDELAQITLDLPSNVAVEWTLPMVKAGHNVYTVPAHERRVQGVLRFESCSVDFDLRLPRACVLIELDGQDQPVLWKELCNRKYDLRLELPAGAASTLFVSGDETFDELLNQPSHSRAWLQKVPIVHFRDAVMSYPYSVGELILRLRTREENLPDINTGCYLASAQNLSKEFMSYSVTSPAFAIPVLGPLLLTYRYLVERPADKCLPVPENNIPAELGAYLTRLRFLASVLDDSIDESNDRRGDATTGLGPDILVNWLREALEKARAGLTDAEISVPPPFELINVLPVPRWIARITGLIGELRQNATLPLLIQEFRNSFESGATTSRVALCQRKGGLDLWHAVNSYRLSLQAPHVSERDQAGQLKRFEAIISDSGTDPVVRFLAQAFQFMNYYRLNRRSMLDTGPFSSWPHMLGTLRSTLAALQAKQAGIMTEIIWPQLGIGLADVSPAIQDAELERHLGRPEQQDAI